MKNDIWIDILVYLIVYSPIIIPVALIIINILKRIIKKCIKRKFIKKYELQYLDDNIVVKKSKPKDKNEFDLKFPHWSKSNKDGTKDKRVACNPIKYEESRLYIDDFLVSSKIPSKILDLVKLLREKGKDIELCKQEKDKITNKIENKKSIVIPKTITEIVSHFSEKPTDFEKLCAEMFRRQGYNAKVTPPTNDGGYDILLKRNGKIVTVECKCYKIEHKIGREAVQKFVGASYIKADEMFFITTSDFNKNVVEYAERLKKSGEKLELINGTKLLKLLEESGFYKNEINEVLKEDCDLTKEDLYQYLPKDMSKRII